MTEPSITLENVRGILIDIDGVLITGDSAISGAQEALDRIKTCGIPFRCVSNSTRRCRASIASRLHRLGIEIQENSIFTPSLAAAKYIKESGRHRVYLLTMRDIEKDFEGLEFGTALPEIDYVVVGDAGDVLTYSSLTKAFRYCLAGAEIIALEKDRYWMASDGLSLSAGPFVTALEYATGKTAMVVGKPSKTFFNLALLDMGIDASNAIMIGDDVFTDIDGAQNIGIRGVLVKTGKYHKEVLEKSGVQPSLILNSIKDICTIL